MPKGWVTLCLGKWYSWVSRILKHISEEICFHDTSFYSTHFIEIIFFALFDLDVPRIFHPTFLAFLFLLSWMSLVDGILFRFYVVIGFKFYEFIVLRSLRCLVFDYNHSSFLLAKILIFLMVCGISCIYMLKLSLFTCFLWKIWCFSLIAGVQLATHL